MQCRLVLKVVLIALSVAFTLYVIKALFINGISSLCYTTQLPEYQKLIMDNVKKVNDEEEANKLENMGSLTSLSFSKTLQAADYKKPTHFETVAEYEEPKPCKGKVICKPKKICQKSVRRHYPICKPMVKPHPQPRSKCEKKNRKVICVRRCW